MRRSITVAIAMVIATTFTHGDETTFFDEPMHLGAHRGGSNLWPESTTAAYEGCLAKWPHIVLEADVRETKDGHIVVSHDAAVGRTTDGEGTVELLTLAELKALDAGYEFTKDSHDTHPYRGKGLKILTLEEALNIAPDSRWLVETKSGPMVVEKTLKIIQDRKMDSRVLLASFKADHMTYAREHAPHIARCFDFETASRLLMAMRGGDWDAYVPDAHVVSLSKDMVSQTGLTSEDLEKLQSKGIFAQVHTVNKKEKMLEFLEFGFHSILSDRPDILAEAIDEYLQASNGSTE